MLNFKKQKVSEVHFFASKIVSLQSDSKTQNFQIGMSKNKQRENKIKSMKDIVIVRSRKLKFIKHIKLELTDLTSARIGTNLKCHYTIHIR